MHIKTEKQYERYMKETQILEATNPHSDSVDAEKMLTKFPKTIFDVTPAISPIIQETKNENLIIKKYPDNYRIKSFFEQFDFKNGYICYHINKKFIQLLESHIIKNYFPQGGLKKYTSNPELKEGKLIHAISSPISHFDLLSTAESTIPEKYYLRLNEISKQIFESFINQINQEKIIKIICPYFNTNEFEYDENLNVIAFNENMNSFIRGHEFYNHVKMENEIIFDTDIILHFMSKEEEKNHRKYISEIKRFNDN